MTNIRNFCIIAHIDHGKSTLADRFLELTGIVEKAEKQMLDTMELEQERGITIKLQPVRMVYRLGVTKPISSDVGRLTNDETGLVTDKPYTLNLIDTPGHVDFSYEVSRSLAAVEGAILLVDASQGIQAQTLSNLYLAQSHNLAIIPVINKIDLPTAEPEKVETELEDLKIDFPCEPILVSAKTGENVEKVLGAIIKFFPSPQGDPLALLRVLVFDSFYDPYRGVVAYVRVVDGEIKKGEKIYLYHGKREGEALEVGKICLGLKPEETLVTGQIGYIVTSFKDLSVVRVGETITHSPFPIPHSHFSPLPGYKEPQSMVFASFYPASPASTRGAEARRGGSQNEEDLREGLEKLKLNDASLVFLPETSKAFGRGFRCGFLGLLHLEIVKERLEREYDLSLVVTTPIVDYRTTNDGFEEPWARLEIIVPAECLGKILNLIAERRGGILSSETLGERVVVKGEAPLAEVIIDFYDRLKSLTSGYGSLFYELAGYRAADLEELNIFIAEEKVEALTQLVPKIKIEKVARGLVEKLENILPRQNFEVKIQAAVGGKFLASERISPFRKDVTAKLYGGDVTRKKKLREKQKKGKKKMARLGKIEVPTEVFIKLLQ